MRKGNQPQTLTDDTIFSDAREGYILVSYTRDGSSSSRNSLDANAILAVLDGGTGDGDRLDGVVRTTTNATD
jgi:hypothetical protein